MTNSAAEEYNPHSGHIGLTQSRHSSIRQGLAELKDDDSLSGIAEGVVVDISWVALRGSKKEASERGPRKCER